MAYPLLPTPSIPFGTNLFYIKLPSKSFDFFSKMIDVYFVTFDVISTTFDSIRAEAYSILTKAASILREAANKISESASGEITADVIRGGNGELYGLTE